MNLVIFDIDGTLTKTNEVDAVAYIEIVQELISKDFQTFDETTFTHYTDSAIVIDLYQKYKDRNPSKEETEAFKNCYLNKLRAANTQDTSHFAMVTGADKILDYIHQHPDWQLALGTGCWQESARLKTQFAGLDISPYPIGTASHALSREDIVRYAQHTAKAFYQQEFEKIVYVGDGLWDVQTCASLGMPFVGIEAENNPKKQALLGDFFLLENYDSPSRFLELLENAKIPNI